MKKFYFSKYMKIFSKHYKLAVLLGLLLFIPLIVFAVGQVLGGYILHSNNGNNYIPIFWNVNNDGNNISTSTGGICFDNLSSNDYFVPTRTFNEFQSFTTNSPTGVSVHTGCCVDGNCDPGETPTNCPADCSPTAVFCSSLNWVNMTSVCTTGGLCSSVPVYKGSNPSNCGINDTYDLGRYCTRDIATCLCTLARWRGSPAPCH